MPAGAAVRGGRPARRGGTDAGVGLSRRETSTTVDGRLTEAAAAADEEADAGDEGVPSLEEGFALSAGMRVAIDAERPVGWAAPDAFHPIASRAAPEGSNVGEVTALKGDECDVTLLCNCACASGGSANSIRGASKDASSKGAAGKGAASGRPSAKRGGAEAKRCSGRCGAGRVVRGLARSQRQIVCPECLHANLPHALPMLRCSGGSAATLHLGRRPLCADATFLIWQVATRRSSRALDSAARPRRVIGTRTSPSASRAPRSRFT